MGIRLLANGVFSISLLSQEFIDGNQLTQNSPGVVRLSSGEFGVVLAAMIIQQKTADLFC